MVPKQNFSLSSTTTSSSTAAAATTTTITTTTAAAPPPTTATIFRSLAYFIGLERWRITYGTVNVTISEIRIK